MKSKENKVSHYTPTGGDIAMATAAVKKLSGSDILKVSGGLKKVVISLLKKIADGQTVSLLSNGREYTTVEASEILHVSRTFLLKEIEAGRLACRMVGSHRRIRAKDLLCYQKTSEKAARKAMKEIARLSQDIEENY